MILWETELDTTTEDTQIMKLIANTIESAQDIKGFIYDDSWCCDHLKRLYDDDLDRICELVASICECYEEMTVTQLNDILRFDEEVNALYNKIIEEEEKEI